MVPTVSFPLATPFTVHVTEVSFVSVTCSVVFPSTPTAAVSGEIEIVTAGGGGGGSIVDDFPELEHPAANATNMTQTAASDHPRDFIDSPQDFRVCRTEKAGAYYEPRDTEKSRQVSENLLPDPECSRLRRGRGKFAELGRFAIGIDPPDLASAEIIEQRLHIDAGNLPRPDYLCGVDVGAIVNPFLARVVAFIVMSEH